MLVDNKPVGFVNFSVFPHPFDGTIAFLHLLGVATMHRRKRYARLLLDKAIEEIKKEKAVYIYLAVKVKNTPARALYEKLGFNPMQPKPLPPGLDNLPVMYKLEL